MLLRRERSGVLHEYTRANHTNDVSIPVRAEDFLVSNVPTAYHSQYSFEYVSHDQEMCKCAIEYLSYVT